MVQKCPLFVNDHAIENVNVPSTYSTKIRTSGNRTSGDCTIVGDPLYIILITLSRPTSNLDTICSLNPLLNLYLKDVYLLVI